MFYKNQSELQKQNYKKMLSTIGNLTLLFSESNCPYLPYRAHENIFCKYLEAENLARKDCSADAKKNKIGVGLKTWMGNDDQKIAEFGKLREKYKDLTGIELVEAISEYRNERIRITKNLYGIDEMIYHIVKRIPGKMQIIEHPFDYIDIKNIKLLKNKNKNKNNTYFCDSKNIYHFSSSKNTLYMQFNTENILDVFEVEIMDDPYSYLMNMTQNIDIPNILSNKISTEKNQICLRLYSVKKGIKTVYKKSGLNQWNAKGRDRDPNEVYIPYPAEDRERNRGFFPERDKSFKLILPDGTVIDAKICQEKGKAIMSNPNKTLGEWLLRKVFELEKYELLTYQMLENFGIDSVIFTKESEYTYSIDFAELGTYEQFYNIE